ncbi:MAG: glycogen debranching enzyme N-terminal domain-containing protein [Paludibacteraceae bacterium]|nr:glycogen debranching enzyme N-terminal domain-containing protein [Paludibacteraceae bacterium]MBN2787935.1 glycogen debranching enzyme N-terminal domain-containing protein [Paludibacteraceae bacterium]
MSYLNFDKTLLINLEKSLTKEMLRTNKSGAYSVTTVIDCNTRKYHGLLVVPLPELSEDNYVLLSSFDETVIQHGAEFHMGIHKFEGDNYSPKGHKYIREFNIETVAATTYRVGGVVFSKERIFISHENRILLKYTLLEARSPVTMRFNPLLAFRSVNELCHENDQLNKEYQEIENGISTCLYPNYPSLCMQFSKPVNFVFQPHWYRGVEYYKEQERGYDFKEDLYVPGYFEMPIKKGESVFFSAGVSVADTTKFKKLYSEELAKRTSRLDFFNCLKNAGQQFYNKIGDGHYLMAGYPWFKCRARDQFVALPGVSLAVDDIPFYKRIMSTAVAAITNYINHQPHNSHINELQDPDVLLWFVWCIQQYAYKTSIKEALEEYGDVLFGVLTFIRQNQHPNLSLSDDGLLHTNGYDKPVSWMNGVAWGKPVTPRTGYLVEINALWYNALKFGADLARQMDNEYEADVLNYQAEFAKQSFIRTFWNGKYLHDYVVNNYKDWEVRPNMIFAVSLPYSTLDKAQQKSIVDIVTRELLTPKGLRSLSPQSGFYRPEYRGDEVGRSYNYHNGTVWPWLMGAFSEAYLKVYKMSGLSFLERRRIGFESEMSELCIGTLNELYDGNPPFKGHGAMSFAMNVSEILRMLSILKKFEEEQNK